MTRPETVAPVLPIAFGHRGALGHGRENTIEAFALGLSLGATGLESDAWLAADDVPVLVHDRILRRGGRRIDVSRRTATELREWGVPSLADLYAACGTAFAVSLDVKHEAVARPLVAVARAEGAVDRLWLCHEDVDLLADLRRWDRDVHLVHSAENRDVHPSFDGHVARMAGLGVDAINMRWRRWSAGRVTSTHRAGLQAFAWDVFEPSDIDGLIDLGLDGIYCDFPERIAAAITARATPRS